MGRVRQTGFTIIETMLFLAISVGLFAVLMIGVTGGIAQERYKDSVNSLATRIQDQYTRVTSVANDRSSDWVCGGELKQDSSVTTTPGSTDCIIIGRFVQLRNGSDIVTSDIIGYNIDQRRLEQAHGDIEALTEAMTLTTPSQKNDALTGAGDETTQVDWGSRAEVLTETGERAGIGSGFTMAIIRSPQTGRVMTFITQQATDDWRGKIITQASARQSLIVCLSPGLPVALPRSAVVVKEATISPNGVTKATGIAGC